MLYNRNDLDVSGSCDTRNLLDVLRRDNYTLRLGRQNLSECLRKRQDRGFLLLYSSGRRRRLRLRAG